MIRFLCTISIIFLCVQNFTAQNWAWMKGDSTYYNESHYFGVQGQANSLNKPGPRCGAAHTSDNQNNLWLFGGSTDYDIYGPYSKNDLWKFNPATNNWTWMNGDTVAGKRGIYGNFGVFNISNKPGSRFASVMWTDNTGNLWLYGGFGKATVNGFFNDLWKYNIITNQWVWISGDSITNKFGNYGNKGIPSTTNKPGGRRFSAHWLDNAGNFWIFGGEGYANSGSDGWLNDLWKFDPTINQWTWISGDSTINQPGIYGSIGIGAITNKPTSRASSSFGKDNAGNFWLFGGKNFKDSTGGVLNDLWKYEPATNKWTWMKGSNAFNPAGNYGNLGVSSLQNVPDGRYGSVLWKDASNNLWLFGGGDGSIHHNDLWKYNLSVNQWTWMKGDSALAIYGFYGQQGIYDPVHKPGERMLSSNWVNNNNALWMFGGARFSTFPTFIYRDLWRFDLSEYVGIEETIENTGLKIYPNPTHDNIIAEMNDTEKNNSLAIYDAKGTLVFKENELINLLNISLKEFDNGIYNIVLTTYQGTRSKKIIKN